MSPCWRAPRGVPMVVGLGRHSRERRRLDPARRRAGRARDRALDGAPGRLASRHRGARRAARGRGAPRSTRPRVTRSRQANPRAHQYRRASPSSTASIPAHATASAWCAPSSCSSRAAPRRARRQQYRTSIARFCEWAAGRPVTIRTLDAGGDKPIPGLTLEGEAIRSSACAACACRCAGRTFSGRSCGRWRARPRSGQSQGDAADGDRRPSELAEARGACSTPRSPSLPPKGLRRAGPPLGIMVEVPAAALTIERFDADFFSIGSNDLVAIRDGLRPRRRRARRARRSAQSGGAAS